MSWYPEMFKPGTDVKSWLVRVNPCGECCVYSLDAEGKATGFCCGTPYDVLARVITETDPCILLSRPAWEREHMDDPEWWFQRFVRDGASWSDVLRLLKSKTDQGRRLRNVFGLLRHLQMPVNRYVKRPPGDAWGEYDFVLTDLALAIDARRVREAEEEKAGEQREAPAP
jgi:hypothetical protein